MTCIVRGARSFTCGRPWHGDDTPHVAKINGVREIVWWNTAEWVIRFIGESHSPYRPTVPSHTGVAADIVAILWDIVAILSTDCMPNVGVTREQIAERIVHVLVLHRLLPEL